jgi:peptidoglycan hydrolase FlgJ
MQISPNIPPPDLLKAAPQTPEGKTREEIAIAAKKFESSFMSIMLGQMFKGVGGGEFGGGAGEEAMESFLMEAFAEKITSGGGIGLAASVQREMLKMQGLE